jgi:hypothetical protein
MGYEPPGGLRKFIEILRRAEVDDACAVLRMAFTNAAATALVDDFRLRCAAPGLLDQCRRALPIFEQNGIDTADLRKAIANVEHLGTDTPTGAARGGAR